MFKKKEEKLKVGRPKLADDITKKKAIIIVVVSLALVLGLLMGAMIQVIGNDNLSLMKGATSSNGYTVRFVKQGEGISGSMSNQVITKTKKLKKLEFKIEKGYKFRGYCAIRFSDSKMYGYSKKTGELGWYKSSELGGCYYWKNKQKILWSLTKPGDVVNLYATAIKEDSIVVKYNNSKAEKPSGYMEEQVFEYGKDIKLNKNELKNDDNVFKGWIIQRQSDGKYYGKKDNKNGWYKDGKFTYIYAGDGATFRPSFVEKGETLIMYADWNGTINIKYTNQSSTGKNAKGSMSSKKVPYTKEMTIDKLGYSNSGYVFKGWIIQRSSDNKYYGVKNGKTGWYRNEKFSYIYMKDGAKLSASFIKANFKENETIKFYASWYKITTTRKYYTTTKQNKTTAKQNTTTTKNTNTTTSKKNSSSGSSNPWGSWYKDVPCSSALSEYACKGAGYKWTGSYCKCN